MSQGEELEIEIGKDGRVQVHVRGMPGRRCLEYVEVFRTFLGPVAEQRPTPEMYAAETHERVERRTQR